MIKWLICLLRGHHDYRQPLPFWVVCRKCGHSEAVF